MSAVQHISDELKTSVRALADQSNNSHVRIVCPACGTSRKKSREATMTVSKLQDKYVFNCHHCEAKGAVFNDTNKDYRPTNSKKDFNQEMRPVKIKVTDTSDLSYLNGRGISDETIKYFGVFTANKFFQSIGSERPAVGFPYYNGDEMYAVKYRCIEQKSITQEGTGGAQTFFNVGGIDEDAEEICIVEGEIDALSIYESGYKNVVSVPNGAPQKVSNNKVDPSEDRKFQYLWKSKDLLNKAKKIIIASDNDAPGNALAEEIARRVGAEKCAKVDWPKDCKDANDVLLKHGVEKLRDLLANPIDWPIIGLYDVNHYEDQVDGLYANGTAQGESTGFTQLDDLFTIAPGQLSIVTGHPSSGKSEFVDQLMVNLAEQSDWKFAICSFENDPPTHIVKLMEKRSRKPFFDGPSKRMTKEEMNEARAWVSDHFLFVDQNDGEPSTIESILDRTRAAIMRSGCRGLVIDPYNFIQISRETTETDAISAMLTRVRLFAKQNDVHVWFVAHPAKMMREGGTFPVPKGYDISGSAAWFAKADLGISVHRAPDADGTSEVHVWKCRFKWVGKIGMGLLGYEKSTGVYRDFEFDIPDIEAPVKSTPENGPAKANKVWWADV